MKIIWDEPKRLANLYRRGLDFASLDIGFFETSVIVPAKKGRSMAVGRFEGRTIAVVFTFLGTEAVSVVSMRVAGKKERRLSE